MRNFFFLTRHFFSAYNRIHESFPKTRLIVDRIYKASTPYIHETSSFICVISSMLTPAGDLCCSENFTTNLTFVISTGCTQSSPLTHYLLCSHFYQNSLLEPLREIYADTVVVFKLGGVFYFRGYVLALSFYHVKVLSLDFGFIAKIAISDLYPLLDIFALNNFPMFSLVCGIDGIDPSDLSTAT